jgi:antitoxin ParD1/3/4
MNVSLTPELERLVEEKVSSGRYKSASEVVRHALREFSDREREYESRLEALRRDIQQGIDSLDAGRGSPGDEVFARLYAKQGIAP